MAQSIATVERERERERETFLEIEKRGGFKHERNRGITLISLVITIVIMLILTGITINLLFGDNGIITKTKMAKKAFLGDDAKQVVEDRVNAYLAEYGTKGELSLYDFWFMYNSQELEDGSDNPNYDENFVIYLFEEDWASVGFKPSVYSKEAQYSSAVVIYKGYSVTLDANLSVKGKAKAVEDLTETQISKLADVSQEAVHESENEGVEVQYVMFEIDGFLSSNCAVINEIEIYNRSNQKISYTPIYAYDSAKSGTPHYWNGTGSWGGCHLNDNITGYGTGSTSFLYSGTSYSANSITSWARVLLKFDNPSYIANIKAYIGDSNGRTPRTVKVYIPDNNLTEDELNTLCESQTESNLQMVGRKDFTQTVSSSREYIFAGPGNVTVEFDSGILSTTDVAKATVTHTGSEINIEACKWVLKSSSEAIGTNSSSYTGGTFSSTTQEIIAGSNLAVGTYYLHILSVDNAGWKLETVSNPIRILDSISAKQYVILEVDGFLSSNSAVINELEINNNSKKINYSPIYAYDSAKSGTPHYWNGTGSWGGCHLNDNITGYGTGSTLFLYSGTSSSANSITSWARVLLKFDNPSYLANIKAYIGDSLGRTPREVKIYLPTSGLEESELITLCDSQTETNLQMIGSKSFTQTVSSSTGYELYKLAISD